MKVRFVLRWMTLLVILMLLLPAAPAGALAQGEQLWQSTSPRFDGAVSLLQQEDGGEPPDGWRDEPSEGPREPLTKQEHRERLAEEKARLEAAGQARPRGLLAPPANDHFDIPTIIASFPYTDALDTTEATVAADDPEMGCGEGVNSNTVWYRFVAPGDGFVNANTVGSRYDTVLAAWRGRRGALTNLACGDDMMGWLPVTTSNINFGVAAGETYYIEVADKGAPGGGEMALRVTFHSCTYAADQATVQGILDSFGLAGFDGYITFVTDASGDRCAITGLNLSSKWLRGPLPGSLGGLANLQALYLQFNNLWGKLPESLGNLANLQILYLHSNRLKGELPDWLGNLANLQVLNLNSNRFRGPLPESLGNLANLQWLLLGGNQLSGALPESLDNLANLLWLDVSYNQLSGTLPESLGNLANLQKLDLSYNHLSGELPESLGNLADLRELYLYRNQLSGSLPESLGNLTNLEVLSLSRNRFSGGLPDWLGNLTSLRWLNLGCNWLSGPLPESLGNLVDLQVLDLSDNQFSGALPASLTNLDLQWFHFNGTDLCEPADAAFQAWLADIWDLSRTNVTCALVLSKYATPDSEVARGVLTYTLTLHNVTQVALNNVVLTDTLPADVTLLSATPPASGMADNRLIWNVGTLPVSGTHTVTLRVQLPLTPGPIVNQAEATGEEGGVLSTRARCTTDISPFCSGVSEIPQAECEALVALYNSTSGANWSDNSGWLDTNMPCSWYGVTCSTGHITRLDLSNNQLHGSLPESLGNLADLQVLDLSDNQLSRSLPESLGNLTNLQVLDLSRNQLSDALPASLGELASLQVLKLHSNQLGGPLPEGLGNLGELEQLDLSGNQLSGALPVSLTNLNVWLFHFNDTDLCEPADVGFQAWLGGIGDLQRTGVICGLVLSKGAGPSSRMAGDVLTYTLTLHNVTQAALNNVVLTDTLPVSVTLLSAAPPASGMVGNRLTWNVGTLPASGTYSATLRVRLPDVPGRILNQAEAAGEDGGPATSHARYTTDVLVRYWLWLPLLRNS